MTIELTMLRSMGTAGSENNSEMFSQCSVDGKNVQRGEVMSVFDDSPFRTRR